MEDDRRPFVDVLAALSFMVLALSTTVGVVGFVRAGHFSMEYNLNSPRLVYTTIAAIVVESVLFGLFLLAVSERLNYDFKFQATHDPLTELYNRRAFEEIGHREVSGAARTGLPLSLFLVDIDHFKRFNEEYGNAIGDFILRAAAGALRDNLRNEDYLCRWGGDQFCALLPRTSLQDAEKVMGRAFAAFAELDIAVEGQPIRVEVSIGIVTREDNALEFPLLVKLANVALHQAKENGRNRFAMV
jgi:diguanylate cyclase (GGDEF)-like protein